MSRRKEPIVPAELLDQLLAGGDAAAAALGACGGRGRLRSMNCAGIVATKPAQATSENSSQISTSAPRATTGCLKAMCRVL